MKLLRTLNRAFPGLFRLAGFFLLSLVVATSGILTYTYSDGRTAMMGLGFVGVGLFLGAYGLYLGG